MPSLLKSAVSALILALPTSAFSAPQTACAGGEPAGVECVDLGNTVAVNSASSCRTVTNNHSSGRALFVPILTAAEFSSFTSAPPANVSLSLCLDTLGLPYAGVGVGSNLGTDIAFGKFQSRRIAAKYASAAAAKFCEDMDYGGYKDWYLPSNDEIQLLYTNRAALGGFTSNYYWSSYDAAGGGDYGYCIQSSDGALLNYCYKANNWFVRCVRKYM